MAKWQGAAGVCVKDGLLLMVLQGKPEEEKRWSVPSGGMEPGETLEMCCVREVLEETGYEVRVVRPVHEKRGSYASIDTEFSVTYYLVEITGGRPTIQDPDGLIYEIAWKSQEELRQLPLSFEEDRPLLLSWAGGREESA
ncbi:NUDIX domain-containing protein [Paenibacillus sp. HJGM_3]|uniref:NUDIX domain-containing protein n=1 Tax=Paenibacillus sp. HJGM_3 TaxID=3379816 RepID=UPI00385B86F5